ncbi:uncharacterized protein G2W53_018537 [Senna tora]|uniref:Uncharacterized protein n=1 Tax=Senna tora TaxID=362788 RepID=A0A834WNF7_9FABA|nr:uncharacterized protein G2W53_018537 [Senna tora]
MPRPLISQYKCHANAVALSRQLSGRGIFSLMPRHHGTYWEILIPNLCHLQAYE